MDHEDEDEDEALMAAARSLCDLARTHENENENEESRPARSCSESSVLDHSGSSATSPPSSSVRLREPATQPQHCSVCLNDIITDLSCPSTTLPCGHRFHAACISAWLENHSSCPTCRNSVLFSGSEGRRIRGGGNANAENAENAEREASHPCNPVLVRTIHTVVNFLIEPLRVHRRRLLRVDEHHVSSPGEEEEDEGEGDSNHIEEGPSSTGYEHVTATHWMLFATLWIAGLVTCIVLSEHVKLINANLF